MSEEGDTARNMYEKRDTAFNTTVCNIKGEEEKLFTTKDNVVVITAGSYS